MLRDASDAHTSCSSVFPSSCSIHALVNQRPFHQCHHPLDLWLCIACLHVVAFVVAFAVGRHAESGAQWWFLDPETRAGRAAFKCTWAVLLPLLAAWTALGMSWLFDTLHNTPDCFPPDGYFTPTSCAMSQVFFGVGAATYAVFVANVWDAQRCRRANAAAIASVEDSDLVKRWGRLRPGVTLDLCGGLLPKEFGELPRHAMSRDGSECVICLSPMLTGDYARSLPGCGHVFHRACIDLWLLRQTTCPLCKVDVRLLKS